MMCHSKWGLDLPDGLECPAPKNKQPNLYRDSPRSYRLASAAVITGEHHATVLALRAHDGATAVVDYPLPLGAFWWTPTPPALAPALLPQWPRVTPWAIANPDRFLIPPPPPPSSATYTQAWNEVRRLGRDVSGVRTAEQTQIALFWADGAGTATPPGHWNLIAQNLTVREHLNLSQSSYFFAILNLAEADAAITAWDFKYRYGYWRPVTAIRNAADDGNPNTVSDPSWSPLLVTPPFPSYISGHSTFSAAAARVMALFFGTDHVQFTTTSDALPGVTRSFNSFSQAAAEAGQSRIYGGIHFQFDNTVGLTTGTAIGHEVFYRVLTPVAAFAACHVTDTTLCLGGNRYEVAVQWNTGAQKGDGHAEPFTDDSGRFWFFDEKNTEVVVKVADACTPFGKHWVFLSGLTNVEVVVSVTDTQTGRVRTYANPNGTAFVPVQDTQAFVCP